MWPHWWSFEGIGQPNVDFDLQIGLGKYCFDLTFNEFQTGHLPKSDMKIQFSMQRIICIFKIIFSFIFNLGKCFLWLTFFCKLYILKHFIS